MSDNILNVTEGTLASVIQPICDCLGDKKVMTQINGLYALTQVTAELGAVTFHPSTGIPVVCFVCNSCGLIKTYSAKRLNKI